LESLRQAEIALDTPLQYNQTGRTLSDLMPLMSWQLWLAREVVRITSSLAEASGTFNARASSSGICSYFSGDSHLAGEPKLRGKSPGWPQGQPRQKRTRYPVVKKSTSKQKKSVKQQNQQPA